MPPHLGQLTSRYIVPIDSFLSVAFLLTGFLCRDQKRKKEREREIFGGREIVREREREILRERDERV